MMITAVKKCQSPLPVLPSVLKSCKEDIIHRLYSMYRSDYILFGMYLLCRERAYFKTNNKFRSTILLYSLVELLSNKWSNNVERVLK